MARHLRKYVGLVGMIFDDPNSLTTESPAGALLTMGMGIGGVLVVEHTLQEDSEEAAIAIMSVRKATPIERLFYEQRRQKDDKHENRGPSGTKRS